MATRKQVEIELEEKGVSVLEDGKIIVKNSEENKDVIRMLQELTE